MCHGQIIDDAIRRARKERLCSECGKPIAQGQRYKRQVSKVDGDFGVVESHLRCSALVSVYNEESGETCYALGDPRDEARELLRSGDETARGLRARLRKAIDTMLGRKSE